MDFPRSVRLSTNGEAAEPTTFCKTSDRSEEFHSRVRLKNCEQWFWNSAILQSHIDFDGKLTCKIAIRNTNTIGCGYNNA